MLERQRRRVPVSDLAGDLHSQRGGGVDHRPDPATILTSVRSGAPSRSAPPVG
jgi:hypothetical protein